MNHIELISRCQKNERKAQADLYHNYKDMLFGMALKYCKNITDAEDILQESFMTIFRQIDSYKGKGSFEGWMKRIVINKSIDKYHDKKVKYLELVEDKIKDEEIEDNLNHFPLDTILRLVQELPNRYRLTFNMYELDGFSHKEISSLMHISEGTSKSNLHRARKILKKNLQNIVLNKKNYG